MEGENNDATIRIDDSLYFQLCMWRVYKKTLKRVKLISKSIRIVIVVICFTLSLIALLCWRFLHHNITHTSQRHPCVENFQKTFTNFFHQHQLSQINLQVPTLYTRSLLLLDTPPHLQPTLLEKAERLFAEKYTQSINQYRKNTPSHTADESLSILSYELSDDRALLNLSISSREHLGIKKNLWTINTADESFFGGLFLWILHEYITGWDAYLLSVIPRTLDAPQSPSSSLIGNSFWDPLFLHKIWENIKFLYLFICNSLPSLAPSPTLATSPTPPTFEPESPLTIPSPSPSYEPPVLYLKPLDAKKALPLKTRPVNHQIASNKTIERAVWMLSICGLVVLISFFYSSLVTSIIASIHKLLFRENFHLKSLSNHSTTQQLGFCVSTLLSLRRIGHRSFADMFATAPVFTGISSIITFALVTGNEVGWSEFDSLYNILAVGALHLFCLVFLKTEASRWLFPRSVLFILVASNDYLFYYSSGYFGLLTMVSSFFCVSVGLVCLFFYETGEDVFVNPCATPSSVKILIRTHAFPTLRRGGLERRGTDRAGRGSEESERTRGEGRESWESRESEPRVGGEGSWESRGEETTIEREGGADAERAEGERETGGVLEVGDPSEWTIKKRKWTEELRYRLRRHPRSQVNQIISIWVEEFQKSATEQLGDSSLYAQQLSKLIFLESVDGFIYQSKSPNTCLFTTSQGECFSKERVVDILESSFGTSPNITELLFDSAIAQQGEEKSMRMLLECLMDSALATTINQQCQSL